MFICWRSRLANIPHLSASLDITQPTLEAMNLRVPDRAVYCRPYDNYHELKHFVHGAASTGITLTTKCVSCSNDPAPLDYADRNLFSMSYPQGGSGFPWLVADSKAQGQHMCFILPCGHLMGWSCMERHKSDLSNRCPRCRTIWFRLEAATHCQHPIVVIPLRQATVLSEEEEEWLIPPGGYLLDKCRLCATVDALRDLTVFLRNAIPGDGSCSYATDGTLNGFLEGDDLKPFSNLEIGIEPPVVPEGLMEEARRVEGMIVRNYEGRTPKAESRMVGAGWGRQFCFRVAGLARSPN
jgi:hypothetical protein|uniref:Uncharacterized protein n=1 Tax=Bionectria ochroleuca TaxID=29856 RepID=A0A8H7NGK4_BIOOC